MLAHGTVHPTEGDMKAHRPTIMGTRHMVAACQYLAAEAGFRVLEAGGNAIDAGVATVSRSASCSPSM